MNGTLNNYSFLITLIHELAHLLTFTQYKNRVEPHGREWKRIYGTMMKDFLTPDIFPPRPVVQHWPVAARPARQQLL